MDIKGDASKIEDAESVKSQHSKHFECCRSHISSEGSVLIDKLAKAKATKAAVEYAKKEAEIKLKCAMMEERQPVLAARATREKAELQTELTLIKQQSEAAQAEAEFEAYQATSEEQDDITHVSLNVPVEDSHKRTVSYVAGLEETSGLLMNQKNDWHSENATKYSVGAAEQLNCNLNPPQASGQLNVNAPCFQPMIELSHLFIKKDLLLSRLRNYNDQPEGYIVWKSCFRSVVEELSVTPDEEMDLLIRWLGPESSKFALSFRRANPQDPQSELRKLWTRLDERYGSPEFVEASLKARLAQYPRLENRDNKTLYELADLVSEFESVKSCDQYSTLLSYFDSSSGVLPIVSKLPPFAQERWITHAYGYKEQHKVAFPPFSVLVDFVNQLSKVRNDPSFIFEPANVQSQRERPAVPTQKLSRPFVFAKKTEIQHESRNRSPQTGTLCPLHKTKHSLNQCVAFRDKPLHEQKQFIKDHRICFECCASDNHIAKFCNQFRKGSLCNSFTHATALHAQDQQLFKDMQFKTSESENRYNAETTFKQSESEPVNSKCTQICGENFSGKSCTKTCLVAVHPKEHPELSVKMYALLDDQSDASLARSEFFDLFHVQSFKVPYVLSSCAGITETFGRKAKDFVVKSIDNDVCLDLPVVTECNYIPDHRNEIPTPDVALNHPHLQGIAKFIPLIDDSTEILFLIGRDPIDTHHVQTQHVGPKKAPYAQKLPLGWVIVGESCSGKVQNPSLINVNKTFVLGNGRPSTFEPCPNKFNMKDKHEKDPLWDESPIGRSVFEITNSVGRGSRLY